MPCLSNFSSSGLFLSNFFTSHVGRDIQKCACLVCGVFALLKDDYLYLSPPLECLLRGCGWQPQGQLKAGNHSLPVFCVCLEGLFLLPLLESIFLVVYLIEVQKYSDTPQQPLSFHNWRRFLSLFCIQRNLFALETVVENLLIVCDLFKQHQNNFSVEVSIYLTSQLSSAGLLHFFHSSE